MMISIPERCPKCNGEDIRPQGDRMVVCMDCDATAEFVFEGNDDKADASPFPFGMKMIPLTGKPEAFAHIADQIKAGSIRFPSSSMLAELSKFPGSTSRSHQRVEPVPVPPHIVDRDGCPLQPHGTEIACHVAQELYDAFAWVDRVEVQRAGLRFVVKVWHTSGRHPRRLVAMAHGPQNLDNGWRGLRAPD